MPRRRVSVELMLEAHNYLTQTKKVIVETKMAEEAIEDLGDEADETSRDLAQLAANTALAKKHVDGLGMDARKSKHELNSFRGELRATAAEARALSMAAGAGEGALGGGGGGGGPFGGGGGFLSGHGRMAMWGRVIAAFSPLFPWLAGAVGGAVLGTVGLGGIIGGAFAASKDPRVRRAFTDLGHMISDDFFDAGQIFVKPLEKSAAIMSRSWREKIKPDLEGLFAEVSPGVEPLTFGLTGLVEQLGPGMRKAGKESVSTMKMLEKELPELGSDFGNFFAIIAAAAPEVNRSLQQLLDTAGGAVRVTGHAINLGATFHSRMTSGNIGERLFKISAPGLFLTGVGSWRAMLSDMNRGMSVGDLSGQITHNLEGIRRKFLENQEAIEANNEELQEFLGNLRGLHTPLLDVEEATSDWEQGLDDLSQSVKDNGTSLDVHTEKGRANRDVLLEAAKNAMEMRDANIRNGMSMKDADKRYQSNIDYLITLAGKLGFNTTQTWNLIGALRNVPAQIIVSFVTKGADWVRSTIDKINSFTGSKFGGKKAAGGPVMPGYTYMVGEAGPEYLTMGQSGGFVTPMSGGGAGGGKLELVLSWKGSNSQMANAFIEGIAVEVRRSRGGRASALGITKAPS